MGEDVQSAMLAWGPSLSAAHSTSVPGVLDHLVLGRSSVCCERDRMVRKGRQEGIVIAKPQSRQLYMVVWGQDDTVKRHYNILESS